MVRRKRDETAKSTKSGKGAKGKKGLKGDKSVKGKKGDKSGKGLKSGRRMPKVPPPDSKIWPEEYRGKRWKKAYAFLFAGCCQVCAYANPLPRSRQLLDKWLRVTRMLLCTNHPSQPGQLSEVLPIETCRNFKPKPWMPARPRRGRRRPHPALEGPPGNVRQIPLGDGLFATVDAADYEELSKYRWFPKRLSHTIYARCRKNRKFVYMHRMIMQPRSGYVVDHIDRNGLHNCRCNLRVCTRRQNQVNRGPCGGASEFVGVYPYGDKWRAEINHRGKHLYAGLFADEVEAAKARDRKAYELHGEYAYLNFPEDFAEE